MPTDEGSGQLPLTLDKGAYTLTADAATDRAGRNTGSAPRTRCVRSR